MANNKRHAAKILNMSTKELFLFSKVKEDKPNYAPTTYPVIMERERKFIETSNFPPTYNRYLSDTVGPLPSGLNEFFRYG